MMNEIAATTEETTAYAIGHTMSTLMNLKRMVEQNMTDYGNCLEGVRGLHPMWGKDKLMSEFDRALQVIDGIKYPYKH